jgi:hypothetical protein
LLGQRLTARGFDRLVAEFRFCFIVLNGFTAISTPITEITGQVCPGMGKLGPSADLCNRALIRLGLDAETAERDAEGIEHHVSDRTLTLFPDLAQGG